MGRGGLLARFWACLGGRQGGEVHCACREEEEGGGGGYGSRFCKYDGVFARKNDSSRILLCFEQRHQPRNPNARKCASGRTSRLPPLTNKRRRSCPQGRFNLGRLIVKKTSPATNPLTSDANDKLSLNAKRILKTFLLCCYVP